MNVLERVLTHLLQVVTLEHVQHFDHHRALRPKASLVDLIAAIDAFRRRAHLRVPAREVSGREQPAVRLHVIADAFSQRTSVEVIARRHQSGMTTVGGVSLFGGGNRAHRARQIGLHKNVADFGHCAVRQKDAFRVGPLRKDRRARLNVLHPKFVNGKSVSELDCRLHDFSK